MPGAVAASWRRRTEPAAWRALALAGLLLSCGGSTQVTAAERPSALATPAQTAPEGTGSLPAGAAASAAEASATSPSEGATSPSEGAASPPEGQDSTPEAPTTLEEALRFLRDAGYGEVARVIEARVAQAKPKMKLEPAQAVLAARYLREGLPSMPEALALSRRMPKTVVELVRSCNERGVEPQEAERMARYFSHLLGHLKPANLAALDENCSHVVGREWHEIDYSGEPLSREKQKRTYTPRGIAHFKDAATLERFFRVESRAPYFDKLYRPEGAVP